MKLHPPSTQKVQKTMLYSGTRSQAQAQDHYQEMSRLCQFPRFLVLTALWSRHSCRCWQKVLRTHKDLQDFEGESQMISTTNIALVSFFSSRKRAFNGYLWHCIRCSYMYQYKIYWPSSLYANTWVRTNCLSFFFW